MYRPFTSSIRSARRKVGGGGATTLTAPSCSGTMTPLEEGDAEDAMTTVPVVSSSLID